MKGSGAGGKAGGERDDPFTRERADNQLFLMYFLFCVYLISTRFHGFLRPGSHPAKANPNPKTTRPANFSSDLADAA
jgi:hypothetical protein